METYIYDIESFRNLFCISFIPIGANQQYINAYIRADMAKDVEAKAIILKGLKVKQFVIFNGFSNSINQTILIRDFFKSHKVIYGYNSSAYDGVMLDIFLYNSRQFHEYTGIHFKTKEHITQFMFRHSNECIQFGKGYFKVLDFYKYYKRPFTDYDIQKILYLDKSFTGLKQVAICLKWYRIQQLPFDVHAVIEDKQVNDVLDYNINDILITHKLVVDQKEELALREELNKEFGDGDKDGTNYSINFKNMSRSSIGKSITTKYYSLISKEDPKEFMDKRTLRYVIHLKDIVKDAIKFKSEKFRLFLKSITDSTIYITSDKDKAKWERSLLFNGTKYIIAKGGIHSKDDPRIYSNKDGYIYRDADVVSYYPRIILNFRISPEHLSEVAFLATVDYTTTSRIKAKKAKQKIKAEGLKIAINRMYGALKDPNDYLYDPRATYLVTFNGQLSLLMLVERLEAIGIHVVSANTDGIVARFKPEQEQAYKDCCAEWEKDTRFELEYTDYERYFRNDVNNYVAIKKGFYKAHDAFMRFGTYEKHGTVYKSIKEIEDAYIKRKGIFIEEPVFNKGFTHPVVSQALNAYFIYDIPIEEYIQNHIKTNDEAIYDYCMAQKIDKKFLCEYHTISDGKKNVEILQQYNRFYVTQRDEGGKILKSANNKQISILANRSVTIFNNYYKLDDTDDYNIHYGYYINACYAILYGKKTKTKIKSVGIVGNSNNLFTQSNIDY